LDATTPNYLQDKALVMKKAFGYLNEIMHEKLEKSQHSFDKADFVNKRTHKKSKKVKKPVKVNHEWEDVPMPSKVSIDHEMLI
jgi:hypothetical protein